MRYPQSHLLTKIKTRSRDANAENRLHADPNNVPSDFRCIAKEYRLTDPSPHQSQAHRAPLEVPWPSSTFEAAHGSEP